MLISIIIPVYNVSEYLEVCLDSIVNQTYRDLQIIIVNDGSTDNSAGIAKDFVDKDDRIRLIHQQNKGLSAARNTGLALAEGDFVFYLDADDFLVENAIEILEATAEKENSDIVQGNFYYDYPEYLLLNQQQKEPVRIYTAKEALWALLEHKTILNFAWGKLIRRELAQKHLFPEGKFYEDGFWKYKLIHDSNVYVALNTPILYYLQRGSAISSNFSLRNLDQLEGEIQRAQFVKNEYGEMYFLKALELLNRKIILHQSLLHQLNEKDAVKYKNVIQEIQDKYALKTKFAKSYTFFGQKRSRIKNAIKNRIFGNKDWKRIEK